MKRLAVGLFVVASLGGIASTAFGQATEPAAKPRGEQVYGELCASCHGRYGRGDGALAANLKGPLVDFTNSAWLGGRSDEAIAKALGTASHGPMTIASALKPEALQDSIAYIRGLSIPGKHVSVLAGRDVYMASCQGCHGAKGDGQGPVAAYLADPKPRDFTSSKFVIDGREAELEKFVSLGAAAAMHGSIYMPEWASRLSPQQIKDTVEYLKTFKQAKH